MIRIVIAGDHPGGRRGLKLRLDAEEDLEVVAEAGDVDSATRTVLGYKPDVLVLDLNMPDGASPPVIPKMLSDPPGTNIVVLTMQEDPAFAREALQAGARGYVLKEAADNELVEAVRMAAEGRTYLHPELGAKIAAQPPQPARPPDHPT